jgi:hypothetical protein
MISNLFQLNSAYYNKQFCTHMRTSQVWPLNNSTVSGRKPSNPHENMQNTGIVTPSNFFMFRRNCDHWVRIPKAKHTALSSHKRHDLFTISAFIRPREWKEQMTILHLDSVNNLQLSFFLTAGKDVMMTLQFEEKYFEDEHAFGTGMTLIKALNSIPINEWSHVCVVKQYQGLRMYLNGEFISQQHQKMNCPKVSCEDWYIGRNITKPDSNFVGDIAHVKLWLRALSYDEARTLSKSNESSSEQLRFHYPLDNNYYGVTKDLSHYKVNAYVSGVLMHVNSFLSLSDRLSDVTFTF